MSSGGSERYLAAISATARPSLEQMRAFAVFVADAHSWYKRLPLTGSGEPFFLYLDIDPHTARIERQDGGHVRRDVIREENVPGFPQYRIDLQPGDVDPGETGPLHYIFGGISTQEYRDRFAGWSYWNWGPPEQPRDEALSSAAHGIRVFDQERVEMPVPPEILDLGLVYLRATVSGHLGPIEDEYENLRKTRDLPDPEDDRKQQIDEMIGAMQRATGRIFGSSGN